MMGCRVCVCERECVNVGKANLIKYRQRSHFNDTPYSFGVITYRPCRHSLDLSLSTFSQAPSQQFGVC